MVPIIHSRVWAIGSHGDQLIWRPLCIQRAEDKDRNMISLVSIWFTEVNSSIKWILTCHCRRYRIEPGLDIPTNGISSPFLCPRQLSKLPLPNKNFVTSDIDRRPGKSLISGRPILRAAKLLVWPEKFALDCLPQENTRSPLTAMPYPTLLSVVPGQSMLGSR